MLVDARRRLLSHTAKAVQDRNGQRFYANSSNRVRDISKIKIKKIVQKKKMGEYKKERTKQKKVTRDKTERRKKKKKDEGIGWKIFTTSEDSAGCQF